MWHPECAGRAPQSQRMCSSEIWLLHGCTLTTEGLRSGGRNSLQTPHWCHRWQATGNRTLGGQATQGAHVPRAVATPQSNETGCLGGRNWGQVAGRGGRLSHTTRKSEGEMCASRSANQGETDFAAAALALSRGRWRPAARVDGDAPSSSDVVSDIRKPLIEVSLRLACSYLVCHGLGDCSTLVPPMQK